VYRDFSEKSRNELLGLVSQVENEKISNFTDWVGDRWYDFESWIGKLNIRNYLNNVNEYHKKVIDKNNATKSSINTIFNKVKSVDASYKDTFSIKKSQLQQWQRYINELSQIVNPRNGKFNAKAMSDAFDGILKQISNDELNSNLEKYVELDKTTGEYTYHWNEIEELFTKDTYSMTDTDYQVLTFILSTMAYENGYIDTENLEKFINCGYTTPSPVTSNDYHTSFEILPNGQKYSYYYIQNKSYMGDTLKTICAMYSNACSVSGNNTNLNALMQAIAENYSVIEWRQKLSPIQMKQDFWSGEITISEETLNNFNKICTPNITLEFVNNTKDGSGLDYYVIKSNASNAGNVLTTTSDGSFVRRNDVSTDNYSDCTLRVYIDCAKNQNSNVVATILNGRSILSEYYQEFDWGQVLTDEAVGLVKQVPVVGNYVSSIYDLGTQAEAIGVISSGLDGIKSADLDDISNISKKTEKRIDAGIGIVNKGLGIYTKYKATEINNQNVQKNQEELEKLSKPLMQKTNLGLVYDTMVVKYDHCTYDDSGKGIKVDGGKDCDKSTCVISPSNYKFDPNVLRKQYDSIMHTTIANEEFAELEKQVKEYITTGNIEEKSILANYVKEWKE
jgi:rhs family protein